MHGNTKQAMLMRVIDLQKALATTPIDGMTGMRQYYEAEIAKLMKRIYR